MTEGTVPERERLDFSHYHLLLASATLSVASGQNTLPTRNAWRKVRSTSSTRDIVLVDLGSTLGTSEHYLLSIIRRVV